MEGAAEFDDQWADDGPLLDASHVGAPVEPPEWLRLQWQLDDQATALGLADDEMDAALERVFHEEWASPDGRPYASPDDLEPMPREIVLAELRERAAEALLDRLADLEGEEAARLAERAAVINALVDSSAGATGDPFRTADASAIAASEITARLKVSARTARGLVAEALSLTDPAAAPVLDALRSRRLSVRRAKAALDAALPVPSEKLPAFLAAAVDIAAPDDPDRTPSPAALARRLQRLVESFTEEPLAARRAKAATDRRVDVDPAGDGMCWLTAYLPLETGAAIDTRLDSIARSLQGADEHRSLAQLRTDAFADLLCDTAPFRAECGTGTGCSTGSDAGAGAGPSAIAEPGGAPRGIASTGARGRSTARARTAAVGPASGVRCETILLLPVGTANGTSDAPAELLGYGPLDAVTARGLAARAATWSQLAVDPASGAPLAIGRARYTPTAAMRRFLGARDATCRFPGCDKPAASNEADHTQEWQEQGATDTDNLALLCREHHRLKSLGYWTVRQIGMPQEKPALAASVVPGALPSISQAGTDPGGTGDADKPPGTLEWTAPSGRSYLTCPYRESLPPF
ncbi:HNH endonuclease signature motif containing protein [Sinomonas cellulolyticus]|uniref:DUF222 domain-containing protein n=1 Tax=Sinomonas cellulolyticus TaxID=2801916 RepID=A0ABS1JYM1_9MICC|nr:MULTISPECIES: HNH endonuclease signature motif containing protein [Sinomonas]MBL0704364.1 DUF222 domain-containing protein [Sinomonas cellulolyticus]